MQQGKNSILDAVKELAAPFLERNQEDEPSDGFCYLHAPKHLERVDPQTFEAVKIIRQHSKLGKRIIDSAEKAHVKFRRVDMDFNNRGSARGDVIETARANSLIEDTTVLPHELMHWVQPDTRIRLDWDLRTRLLATLSMEAGAETCAVRVTHEMHENGYSDSFNYFAHGDGGFFKNYRPLYKIYDAIKTESLRTKSDAEATLDAGTSTFDGYFDCAALVSGYADAILLDYIEHSSPHHYPIPGFDLDKAKAQARIGENEYLVRRVLLPLDDDDLFKRNRTLKQAFDYAELIHIYNYYDQKKSNLAVKRKIRDLELNGNPFLKVNLFDAVKEYHAQQDGKDKKSLLRVMKGLAGIDAPQVSPPAPEAG